MGTTWRRRRRGRSRRPMGLKTRVYVGVGMRAHLTCVAKVMSNSTQRKCMHHKLNNTLLLCAIKMRMHASQLLVISPSHFSFLRCHVALVFTSCAVVARWAFPSPLIGAGCLWPGSELAVFPGTLAPAVRLTLFACPREGEPVRMQVCEGYMAVSFIWQKCSGEKGVGQSKHV